LGRNCMRNFAWHWINFVKITAISHSWFLKITGALDLEILQISS
jgi:hypothetical protein